MISAYPPPLASGWPLTGTSRPVVSRAAVCGNLAVEGVLPATLDGTFERLGSPAGGCQPLTGDPRLAAIRLRDGRAEWAKMARLAAPVSDPDSDGDDDALDEVDDGFLTVASPDLAGTLEDGFSSHAQYDPITGERSLVAYHHDAPYAQHLIFDAEGRVRRAEPISVERAAMMQAYSLTDHYAILYDLPAVHRAGTADASQSPYVWDDSQGARLGILPREGTDRDVRWIDIEPCYVFHAMNAYESGDGQIVIDVVRHERIDDHEAGLPAGTSPALWRWTVDLAGGTVREELIDGRPQEFPTVDARYSGCACQYGLTTTGRELLRHNLPAGTSQRHDFGPSAVVGDPVFVPRSVTAAEGDGWVLALVADRDGGPGRLAVLDTADFAGDPVAVVWLPSAAPRGCHSAWLPRAAE